MIPRCKISDLISLFCTVNFAVACCHVHHNLLSHSLSLDFITSNMQQLLNRGRLKDDSEVRYINNTMYRHQCSVCECCNSKAWYVEGNKQCNCTELHVTGCHESNMLFIVQNIRKMPPEIPRFATDEEP